MSATFPLRILLLLTTLPTWCAAHPQSKEEIRIRVHYTARFFQFEGQETRQEEEAILDIGYKISRFYSLSSTGREEIRDSIAAQGGNMSDIMDALERSGYPRTNLHYQVWKHHPSADILTYTDKEIRNFRYSEPLQRPQWTLRNQDSIVANYPCHLAETFYLGRHWRAWFTTELPVSEGPWKLHGLPGLILHAADSDGLFSFSCIEIEKGAGKTLSLPRRKYISCTKEEYHNLIRLKWQNPQAFSERMMGFKDNAHDANGRPLTYPERTALLLEK